jgi:acetate---CoA ligase (ADP-forming)
VITTRADALKAFFEAGSVAVVGASADRTKIAGRSIYYLHNLGYKGRVYAVNPKYDELYGQPAYASIADLPEAPELALILLPASAAIEAVKAAGEAGVKAAVVFANGFADANREDLQIELAQAARAHGVSLLGPNCLGAVNTYTNLTASFSAYLGRGMFHKGRTALLTQSGSVGNGIMMNLQTRGVGISKWVASGNEATLGILDFAEYVLEDEDSSVICMFTESFRDGWRWRDLGALAAERGKSVVVFKGGRGQRSRLAVSTHSGRLAGEYQVWRDIASIAGIIAVDTVEELCDVTYALSVVDRWPNGKVGMFGSGGLGVAFSADCDRLGVRLADLTEATTARLAELLPPAAAIGNPIDPTPVTVEVAFEAADILGQDPDVGVLVMFITSLSRDYSTVSVKLKALASSLRSQGKVLVLTYYASTDRLPYDVERDLSSEGIVILGDGTRVASTLGLVHPERQDIAAPAHRVGISLGWRDLASRLARGGVGLVETHVVTTPAEVAASLLRFQTVVIKLDDPDLPHKTEGGAVMTGINTEREAVDAYEHLLKLRRSDEARVLVQPQIEGVEALVGCITDPEFGRVVMVGTGGVRAELLRDIAFGWCPISVEGALGLIAKTRLADVLTGYRGGTQYDIPALGQLVAKLSEAFADSPDLAELELNPVFVMKVGHGAVAADVLGVPAS